MKKRVMVVDDSRLVRVQLEDVLEGTDYEVAAYCRSGEEAIEQYGSVLPDVVTMDIIMKGMDGLDAAEVILRSHPDARIVMISSLAYGSTRSSWCGCSGRRWSRGRAAPTRLALQLTTLPAERRECALKGLLSQNHPV